VVLTSACVPRRPEVCVRAASLAGARAQKVRDGENLPAHSLPLHELVRPVIWGEKGQDGADCCCKDQLQKRYQSIKLNICTIAGSAGSIDRNSPPVPRDQQGLHRSKRADPPGDTHHWTPRRLVCHNRHPQSHGTHPNPRPRPRRMGPPLDP
jgi:hypothetical protein